MGEQQIPHAQVIAVAVVLADNALRPLARVDRDRAALDADPLALDQHSESLALKEAVMLQPIQVGEHVAVTALGLTHACLDFSLLYFAM
jgi:hypothetical protein